MQLTGGWNSKCPINKRLPGRAETAAHRVDSDLYASISSLHTWPIFFADTSVRALFWEQVSYLKSFGQLRARTKFLLESFGQ